MGEHPDYVLDRVGLAVAPCTSTESEGFREHVVLLVCVGNSEDTVL